MTREHAAVIRMLADPQFGALRRYAEEDWLVIFVNGATPGRWYRGTCLEALAAQWAADHA